MMRQFHTAFALPLLLLAACGEETAPEGGTDAAAENEATGSVLGGTISDDMLPLEQLSSQSPSAKDDPDGARSTDASGSEDAPSSAGGSNASASGNEPAAQTGDDEAASGNSVPAPAPAQTSSSPSPTPPPAAPDTTSVAPPLGDGR